MGALAFACQAAPAAAATDELRAPNRVPGEVIVQFDRGASGTERSAARAGAGTEAAEALGSPGLQLVEVTDGDSVARTIRELEADPAVRFAEPNTVAQPQAIPDDANFGQLWGLHNTGQTVNGAAGTADADIDAPEAWDVETGDPGTVIAVLDTGIDPTHPDLAGNLWQNGGEVGGNGVDDDGNGFVDDVIGFDFVDADANPNDEDGDPLDAVGHGTHVAGTIAATGGNGQGITGVSQDAQIMSLRVCGVFGCDTADTIQAINYAAANGARVLNASLGGVAPPSIAQRDAIFSHPEVLHVFSAGNGGADGVGDDNDVAPSYPCSHKPPDPAMVDNVICVAATTQTDDRAGFSNFGAANVDLGAPGRNVQSTTAEREYLFDTFPTPGDFTAGWIGINDQNWSHSTEAPLSAGNPGITDSPGGVDYDPSKTYGTLSDLVPVNAVAERGCSVGIAQGIDLAAGDQLRVGLTHPDGNQYYGFDEGDDSGIEVWTLDYPTPLGSGNLGVFLQLIADGADEGDGVHVTGLSLDCGETPGAHDFGFKAGTSMASPHVAGAAGLLVSRNPAASTTEIRDKLLATVDPVASMAGRTTTGGRLNVGTAVTRMPAETSITSGPGEGEEIGTPTASFGVTSNDPAATFQCSLDGADYAPCGAGGTAEIGPLGPGAHDLAVRSIDPRGNADATPATRSFAVEGVAPETTIERAPKRRTKKRKATIVFSANEPGATFQCSVDRKPFTDCRSPRRLKRVRVAKHTFQVRATDAVGNVEATPAKTRWRVKPKRKR